MLSMKMIHKVFLFIYNDIIKNPNNYFLIFYLIWMFTITWIK
jgi:hypothetical protein